MSTEIELGTLRAENQRLQKDLEQVRRESAKYRTDRSGKLKGAEEQLAAITKELEQANKERTKIAKQLEELPKETQAENERLKGEIRTRTHRDKFNEIAKEAKADPSALEALWRLSDYKPDADDVDADKLKEVVSKTLEANPLLKGAPAQRVFQSGPGGGQGGKASNIAGSFRCSQAQYSDPHFVSQNYQAIQTAAASGNLTVVPGN